MKKDTIYCSYESRSNAVLILEKIDDLFYVTYSKNEFIEDSIRFELNQKKEALDKFFQIARTIAKLDILLFE